MAPKTGILADVIEAPPEPEDGSGNTTIDTAIRRYLLDVKATKKLSTYRA